MVLIVATDSSGKVLLPSAERSGIFDHLPAGLRDCRGFGLAGGG